ncbi:GNAT family N-acetyltransferase [candidate division GN15 bacterium]|nr:GNAT family N-acetyltransferase [candidate division GN15 bacterium]
MTTRPFTILAKTDDDKQWINDWLSGGGATYIISCMRKLYPADLPGLVAEDADGNRVGLLTYEIIGDQCEVVTLDAFNQWSGIGTALMARAREIAVDAGCKRLWLITTNDNVDAIRFYQKRGLMIATVHVNGLEQYRTLKPMIPNIGNYGIPLRDAIEFEMWL